MGSTRKFNKLGPATANFRRICFGLTICSNLAALPSRDNLPQFLHVLARNDLVLNTAQH
jgi:hypothetical protein